jgi:ribonuclease Z
LSFQLTILGSSSATPTSNRNPTAQHLCFLDRNFLIDCGEGTQMQLRRFKIKFTRINHIFISHLHGDHYLGLIGFLSSLHLFGITQDIHLYCQTPLKEIIDIQLKHSDTHLKFNLVYHFLDTTKSEVIFEDEKVKVESIPLSHRIPCCGFIFREKPGLLSVRKEMISYHLLSTKDILKIKKGEDIVTAEGKVIKNKVLTYPSAPLRSYAFCSDTVYDESLIPNLKKVSLLYHEATFLHAMEKRAKETFHSTAEQAALIAKKAQVQKLIIGHFSARYKDLTPLLEESRQVFKNTELAIEGTCFELNEG